jgi:hypothetical protein
VVTCTLRIGDRVALSSGAAPEVEYALFDAGEIELAATGPGMVQEIGYQTTTDDALGRLKDAGLTWSVVVETAAAMQPVLAMSYARGLAVRRVATAFGPAELFEGQFYDRAAKHYVGRWLDLPSLGEDIGVPRLSHLLQAMHLVAVLREATSGDVVRLSTKDIMAHSRPGQRSFRRGTIPPLGGLPGKLRSFAVEARDTIVERHKAKAEREEGPSATEILGVLEDRIVLTPEAESQDRLRGIARAVSVRERAVEGHLAMPELAALDEELSRGVVAGIAERVEVLERTHGKLGALGYLRLRTQFLAGREPPRAIAEKVSGLALTLPTLAPLQLLAAEAWNAAGEPSRALPFARDLLSSGSARGGLEVPSDVAIDISKRQTASPPKPGPVTPPFGFAPDLPDPPTVPAPAESAPSLSAVPTARASQMPSGRSTQPLPMMDGPPPFRTPAPHVAPKTPRPRKETPPMAFGMAEEPPRQGPPSAAKLARPANRISGTWVGPPPPRPPPSEPAASRPSTPTQRTPSPPIPRRSSEPTVPASLRPAEAPRLVTQAPTELMRGASQPPFRSDSPDAHVHVPRPPSVPRFAEVESASSLELPVGLQGTPGPPNTLPRTVLDARIQFTFLSRELGAEYEQLGIELVTDVSGVEAMQRILLERYASRAVTTPEAAADVRRHGAFLSEILARTFGAFWVDIGPSDVGYWSMVVPPGTRVWPFGRILRLIAMQHNERDLVSYYLELQARADGR